MTSPPSDESWPLPSEDASSWFIQEDWPLYLGLLVCALFGCAVGVKLHDKITPGKFDLILKEVVKLETRTYHSSFKRHS